MRLTDPDPTLGDLARLHPGVPRLLESFHLDYCCGGSRHLADACRAAGVDPHHVRAAIDALGEETRDRWDELGPTALVDHIEATHHRHLDTELGRLQALVDKVVGVHGDRHPELHEVADLYAELRADLEPHLRKEELVLFPLIRALEAGESTEDLPVPSLRGPVSCMLLEHGLAGEVLGRLSQVTDGYQPPVDACASYQALYAGLGELEADVHLHIHKENNVLFPAALMLEAG